MILLFGDVPSFLTTLDTAPATTAKLRSILNDPTERSLLELQIAAVVDVGELLVKATYSLEGHGALAFQCYEVLSTLLATFQTAYCPNIDAVTSKLAGGLPHIQQQWRTYALGCVKPGVDYLQNTMPGKLKNSLEVFKAAKLFNPKKVNEMKPTATSISCLSVITITFLDNAEIENLKRELPVYLTKADDLSPDCKKIGQSSSQPSFYVPNDYRIAYYRPSATRRKTFQDSRSVLYKLMALQNLENILLHLRYKLMNQKVPTLLIGMRHVFSGTAEVTLETFILDDI